MFSGVLKVALNDSRGAPINLRFTSEETRIKRLGRHLKLSLLRSTGPVAEG